VTYKYKRLRFLFITLSALVVDVSGREVSE
jgi:hypothetical protein